MEEQVRRDHEQEPVELSADELEAEEAAELPDREALSLVTPPDGLGSFTPIGGGSPPLHGPPDYTTQPMPPTTYN